MRALECPRCGAPVHAQPGVVQVNCRYCGASLERQPELRPHVPERRPMPAPARSQNHAGIIIALASFLVVAGVASILAFAGARSSGAAAPGEGPTVSSAELVALPLETSAAAAAARFQAKLRDAKNLDLTLRDSPIQRATLSFEDPAHLTYVNLVFRDESVKAAIIASLREQLGPSFHPASTGGHQISVQGVSLSLSSSLSLNAHSRDDPRWKPRFAALWTAIRRAALGASAPLDEKTRRDALNLDYPLGDLKKLAVTTTLETGPGSLRAVFPGTEVSGAGASVGLGHPWFESARVSWANEPNGRLTSVNLYFWTDESITPKLDAVERCIEPVAGKATRQVMDHAAGKYNLDWPAKAGRPRVHATTQLVMLFPENRKANATTTAGFTQVIDRLAACR